MPTSEAADRSAQVSIRFDPDQMRKLRRLARAQDRSVAYVVRAAVDAIGTTPGDTRTATPADAATA